MKGRKPTPTKLKILRGGRAKKASGEPMPDCAMPDCPEHLNDEARAEWHRLAKELSRLGLLTRIDRAVMAAVCVCWSRWVASEQQVAALGTVVKSPNGYPILNPHLSVANEALRQMKSFLTELGLSPSARSRISVASPASAKKSKLAAFLEGAS